MNNKDLGIMVGTSVAFVTTAVTGIIYLVKTKKKKNVKTKLKENLEIVGREHWMSKKSQKARLEIYEWVKAAKIQNNEIEAALRVIEKEHWMSKNYQTSFRAITDYIWNNIIKEERI